MVGVVGEEVALTHNNLASTVEQHTVAHMMLHMALISALALVVGVGHTLASLRLHSSSLGKKEHRKVCT